MLTVLLVLLATLSCCQGIPELEMRILSYVSRQSMNDVITVSCWVKNGTDDIRDYDLLNIFITKNTGDEEYVMANMSSATNTETLIYVNDRISNFTGRISNYTGRISNENGAAGSIQLTWTSNVYNVYGTYHCSGEVQHHKSKIFSVVNATKLTVQNQETLQWLSWKTLLGSNLDKEMERMNGSNFDIMSTYSAQSWPHRAYGLLQPIQGCPKDLNGKWLSNGSKKIHSESSIDKDAAKSNARYQYKDIVLLNGRNLDAVSSGSHLQVPISVHEDEQQYVVLYYCVKLDSFNSNVTYWPSGTYCINRKGNCPFGFTEGEVYIDEEDDLGDRGFVDGVVPDLFLSNLHQFCCRRDQSAFLPVLLPSASPFYLYRYGGKCQEVLNMQVMEEVLYIDTEDTNNGDKRRGNCPDGTTKDTTFQLCYYFPN